MLLRGVHKPSVVLYGSSSVRRRYAQESDVLLLEECGTTIRDVQCAWCHALWLVGFEYHVIIAVMPKCVWAWEWMVCFCGGWVESFLLLLAQETATWASDPVQCMKMPRLVKIGLQKQWKVTFRLMVLQGCAQQHNIPFLKCHKTAPTYAEFRVWRGHVYTTLLWLVITSLFSVDHDLMCLEEGWAQLFRKYLLLKPRKVSL